MRARKRRSHSPVKDKETVPKDRFDPAAILDPLIDQIEDALRPLAQFPDRVRIASGGEKQDIEKGIHWSKKVMPVIQDLSQEFQLEPFEIKAILLKWWNPVDIGFIERLATAVKGSRKQVQRGSACAILS